MITAWISSGGNEEIPPLGSQHRRPHVESARLARLAMKLLDGRTFARLGLCVGSERGSTTADREFAGDLQRKGPAFGSPSLFVYTLGSAALGEMAIALGATGPVLSVSAGNCSGANALLTALDWLTSDSADAVIAGVCEGAEATLFLLEKSATSQLSGTSCFAPGTSPQTAPLRHVAAALAKGQGLVLTAVDPLGFQTTLQVTP